MMFKVFTTLLAGVLILLLIDIISGKEALIATIVITIGGMWLKD